MQQQPAVRNRAIVMTRQAPAKTAASREAMMQQMQEKYPSLSGFEFENAMAQLKIDEELDTQGVDAYAPYVFTEGYITGEENF